MNKILNCINKIFARKMKNRLILKIHKMKIIYYKTKVMKILRYQINLKRIKSYNLINLTINNNSKIKYYNKMNKNFNYLKILINNKKL
jgi:hypothetical protein